MIEQELKELVENHVSTPGSTLYVQGYIPTSGVPRDYEVTVLPPGGYQDLVRESLEVLRSKPQHFSRTVEVLVSGDPECTPEVVEKATQELVDSFEKSLDPDVPAREFKPSDTPVTHGLTRSDKEDGVWYLTGLRKVNVASGPEDEEENRRTPSKNPVVRMKARLKFILPVGEYIPKLKLQENKYDRVFIRL